MPDARYRRTIVASFIGVFNQALTTNLIAILFIPVMQIYGLRYSALGLLAAVNFISQVAADLIFSALVDRIGFKKVVIPANCLFFAGLVLLALAPVLFPDNILAGLILATVVYSFSGGMCEISLSPLIDAIPTENKSRSMALLHGVYPWAQIAIILVTTLLLAVLGNAGWQWIAGAWALLPLIDIALFLLSPFPPVIPAEKRTPAKRLLLNPFYLLCMAAILFGGAAEVTINQWISSFLERGMQLPKAVGDLVGVCSFAFTFGIARLLFAAKGHKYSLSRLLVFSSLLAFICYLTASLVDLPVVGIAACALCGFGVALLWPGTLLVASDRFPMGGGLLFGLLAVAGDVGAAAGPWATGLVVDARLAAGAAESAGLQTGLLFAALFPLICAILHFLLGAMRKKEKKREAQRGAAS